jgi:hypothetical protein
MKDLSKKQIDLKNIKNLYFCYKTKHDGDSLDYRILVNVQEQDKNSLYETEKQGFEVVKIICNE